MGDLYESLGCNRLPSSPVFSCLSFLFTSRLPVSAPSHAARGWRS